MMSHLQSCLLGTLDYACSYNHSAPDAKGDPIDRTIMGGIGYCNINMDNTLYQDASHFGITDHLQGSNNQDYATNQAIYGGHFQLGIPAEGSADNWTYEIVYNPRISNASDGTCGVSIPDTQYTPCMIKTVPTTYTVGAYVPLTQQQATTLTDSDLRAATLTYNQNNPSTQVTYPPKDGTYNLYFLPGATPPDNPVVPCLLSPPQNNSGFTTNTPMCAAAVVGKVPNIENDPSAAIPLSDYPDPNQYQSAYTDGIFKLGMNELTPPVTNTYYGPSMQNSNNLGLGLYAIATSPVYGCLPGETHGTEPNCLVEYPLSIPQNLPVTSNGQTTEEPNQILALSSQYMGDVPPPPVYPVQIDSLLINALNTSASYLGAYMPGLMNGDKLSISIPGATPSTATFLPPNGQKPVFNGLTPGQTYKLTATALNAQNTPISAPFSASFTEYATYPITYGPVMLYRVDNNWRFATLLPKTIPSGTTFVFLATPEGASSPICATSFKLGGPQPICNANITPGATYTITVYSVSGIQYSSAITSNNTKAQIISVADASALNAPLVGVVRA
jgi:hypothetical protein